MEGAGLAGRLGGEDVGPEGGVGGFCGDATGAKSPMVNASAARMRFRFMRGILGAELLLYRILGGPFVWVKAFEGAAPGGL